MFFYFQIEKSLLTFFPVASVLAGGLGLGGRAGPDRRWGRATLFCGSVFSNTALSWLTVGLTASPGPTEAAAAVRAGAGRGAGRGAGGSSSRSKASVEPLKRATTSRRLSWKPDARSFFSKIRLVAACFSWRRHQSVTALSQNENKQEGTADVLPTCRVRCSKILLVSWSLEKPPPSPPGLESKRLTLSDTVAPSLSRALWSTFSLRLDALGRDSFTDCSTPGGDEGGNSDRKIVTSKRVKEEGKHSSFTPHWSHWVSGQ